MAVIRNKLMQNMVMQQNDWNGAIIERNKKAIPAMQKRVIPLHRMGIAN